VLIRPLVTSTLVAIGLCAGAVTATADDGWGTVECDQASTPECDVEVGDPGRPGSAPVQASTPDSHDGDTDQSTCVSQPSPFQGQCELTGVIITPGGALSSGEVARLARNHLKLPRPELGSNPAGDQLVNLPTWLYLVAGWRTVSATASVPGVSVTATAAPTSVTWAMGDGAPVECAGPGTRYYRAADPRSESPDCGHTYRRSSGHTTFPVTATIHWSVTWSGAGQTGTLPELTTTASSQFRVRESQALNVTPPTR
jgi:hypothetical protein